MCTRRSDDPELKLLRDVRRHPSISPRGVRSRWLANAARDGTCVAGAPGSLQKDRSGAADACVQRLADIALWKPCQRRQSGLGLHGTPGKSPTRSHAGRGTRRQKPHPRRAHARLRWRSRLRVDRPRRVSSADSRRRERLHLDSQPPQHRPQAQSRRCRDDASGH